VAVFLTLVLPIEACIDDTASTASDLPTDCRVPTTATGGLGEPNVNHEAGRWLAVVGTDYQVSEVSIVDLQEMRAQDSAFLHSGSRLTCIGTALSGDVVLGRAAAGDGTFVLIDRTTGVLTWVGARQVLAQVAVGNGFFANPQDAVRVSANKVWVSRAQANPKAASGRAAYDAGDDLAVVDLALRRVTGRIAMTAYASRPGVQAWPGRMAFDGQRVWVPLASISADFQTIGSGRIVAIDALSNEVVRVVETTASKNCVATRHVAGSDDVVAVCSGFYKDPAPQRANTSRVIRLSVSSTATAADTVVVAKDSQTLRAFGPDLVQHADGRGWVVLEGSLEPPVPDALWQYDLETGSLSHVLEGSGPFSLTSLFLDRKRQRLWLTDRTAKNGDLVVLDVGVVGKPTVAMRLDSNPAGLRATEMAGF
jgi:hypothetical protein